MSVFKHVAPGYADVFEDGKFIGCIERRISKYNPAANGWYAYDQNRKRINIVPLKGRELARDKVDQNYKQQLKFGQSQATQPMKLQDALNLQQEIIEAIESGLVSRPSAEVWFDICYPIHPLFGPNHITVKETEKWIANYKLILGREYKPPKEHP